MIEIYEEYKTIINELYINWDANLSDLILGYVFLPNIHKKTEHLIMKILYQHRISYSIKRRGLRKHPLILKYISKHPSNIRFITIDFININIININNKKKLTDSIYVWYNRKCPLSCEDKKGKSYYAWYGNMHVDKKAYWEHIREYVNDIIQQLNTL